MRWHNNGLNWESAYSDSLLRRSASNFPNAYHQTEMCRQLFSSTTIIRFHNHTFLLRLTLGGRNPLHGCNVTFGKLLSIIVGHPEHLCILVLFDILVNKAVKVAFVREPLVGVDRLFGHEMVLVVNI